MAYKRIAFHFSLKMTHKHTTYIINVKKKKQEFEDLQIDQFLEYQLVQSHGPWHLQRY